MFIFLNPNWVGFLGARFEVEGGDEGDPPSAL